MLTAVLGKPGALEFALVAFPVAAACVLIARFFRSAAGISWTFALTPFVVAMNGFLFLVFIPATPEEFASRPAAWAFIVVSGVLLILAASLVPGLDAIDDQHDEP